ncbi:hypothetical protein LQW54_009250 [Pestalotiopsis sp. IQ-011]
MSIVHTVDALVESGQMLKAYWQRLSPAPSDEMYLEAAMICHKNIARVAENNTLTQRYSLVLDQLRMEVLSRINGQLDPPAAPVARHEAPPTALSQDLSRSTTVLGGSDPTTMPGALSTFSSNSLPNDLADLNASPATPMVNVIDWNQFDSMV